MKLNESIIIGRLNKKHKELISDIKNIIKEILIEGKDTSREPNSNS